MDVISKQSNTDAMLDVKFFRNNEQNEWLVRQFEIFLNESFLAEKFIPRPDISIVFHFKDCPLISGKTNIQLEPFFTAPIIPKSIVLNFNGTMDTFIVICKPTVFSRVFGIDLTPIPKRSIDLPNAIFQPLWKELSQLKTTEERIDHFTCFINSFQQTSYQPDAIDLFYEKITDATSDIWIPIHMNHMYVNEAYRVWHGEPFKEGYRQAPPNTDHFDLHWQGPATDTKYKALELIPGLNIGGFFDAGDFDIETGANIGVVQNLVLTWEYFKPTRDQTFVDHTQRYVDLHRPDGTPDMLQFIEHGTMQLVAQAEIIGHMAQTLSNAVLDNYHHLGDAASLTDGLPYNAELGPYEVAADGRSSGVKDDMWAFTTRNPSLDLRAATTFAAASRALKGYNDDLSERALHQSRRLLKEASEMLAERPLQEEGRYFGSGDIATYLELYISTGEHLINASHAYKVSSWLFGCHPYHNYSLVATLGATRPKSVFYGNNRADFSFIPGNMAPGILFRKPDHFENYDDWPFLWGQNEGTIGGNTGYLIFGSAFKHLIK